MIGARWVLRAAQGGEEMTVSNASKAIEVGERGVYHAKVVLHEEPRKPLGELLSTLPARSGACFRAVRAWERYDGSNPRSVIITEPAPFAFTGSG